MQQTLDARAPGLVNDVALHHQVVVNELRRVGVIGPNTPHPGGSQDHHIRPLSLHEVAHGRLFQQVQFGACASEDLQVLAALDTGLQAAQHGRAHHTPVAGKKNFHGCASLLLPLTLTVAILNTRCGARSP